jgi:tetratricopeptide (TPR) repeat protein
VQLKSVKTLSLLLIAIAVVYIGCSSGDGPTPYDVNKELQRAWDFFAVNDYDQALNVFIDVLQHSDNNPEALMGKGWCFAFNQDYDSSISSFEAANDNGLDTPDALMGLAVVYRDYPDYSLGLTHGLQVIEADSLYVFSERTTIDYRDARLITAECAYRLGKAYFSTAHEQINYLCDLEGLPLLPDPGTIPVEDYEMQMVQKLEDLTGLIGD